MEIISYGSGVFTISEFLSDRECQQIIQRADQQGYESATINGMEGAFMDKRIRNNDRFIFDDQGLADQLFLRARKYLPAIYQDWYVKSLNEKFRFYRYVPGQYFKLHRDGRFQRNETEESLLTFIIYLNEDFSGGETRFQWDKVKPQKGMALVFPHHLFHEGMTVDEGTKYALRTDVMYSAQPELAE